MNSLWAIYTLWHGVLYEYKNWETGHQLAVFLPRTIFICSSTFEELFRLHSFSRHYPAFHWLVDQELTVLCSELALIHLRVEELELHTLTLQCFKLAGNYHDVEQWVDSKHIFISPKYVYYRNLPTGYRRLREAESWKKTKTKHCSIFILLHTIHLMSPEEQENRQHFLILINLINS